MSENLLSRPVALLGVPFDAHSSFLRGSSLGPARIRETLHSASGNWYTETGAYLGGEAAWFDRGDVSLPSEGNALAAVEEGALEILRQGYRLLSLGGDHSVTLPLVKAYARVCSPPVILHLDAHGDLYDSLDGNRFSHACPFARILEDGAAAKLVQIGLRALTEDQRERARRFSVVQLEMKDCTADSIRRLLSEELADLGEAGGIYLSLDLDVLDPAFAPGVSHHEPGGMSSRELLSLIQGLAVPILGADIVEYNPVRDPAGVTGMVAAKLVKEILAKMSYSRPEAS